MSTRTRTAALALVAAAPFLLVACGDDDGGTAADIPASADFNAADVAFATQMIPHHAQALQMVEMAEGRDLSPEVADLVERIGAAQAPEIEQMAAWLEEWDQPVPETDSPMGMSGGMGGDTDGDMSGDMDHADMDHGDTDEDGDEDAMDMDEMPGMMSDAELDDLDAADGDAFERMWLAMMVEHHEGAIEMAETEVDEGEDPDALDLARSIADSQSAEVEEMKALLGA